jgi:peptidoglycan/xylan/chitin deacetylase (PgdA/CDA1 family)
MDDTHLAAPSALKSYARTSALSVALSSGISHWLAHRHPVRRILMLHGVGGAKMTQGDFFRVMSWLKQRFDIVPLDAMIRDILSGEPAPSGAGRSQLAITFDDGLRNQYLIARPALAQLEIPATIFVCPGLVESGQWMWNHDARARLNRLGPEAFAEWAQHVNSSSQQTEGVIAWMKTLSLPERLQVQAQLRDCTTDFVPTQEEHAAYDLMDWEEIRGCDSGLMAIGSHTMTHPILPTLTVPEIQRELQDSRDILEARLGRTVDVFCFPNGSTDERVRQIARSIYRAALTTEEGMVTPSVDPIGIPRIPVTSHLPLLAWRMHRPWA